MESLILGVVVLILGSILYFVVEEQLRPGRYMYLKYKDMAANPEVSERGRESAKQWMADFKPINTAFYFVHFIGLTLIFISGFIAHPFFAPLTK